MRAKKEYTEFGIWLKTELMKQNMTSSELADQTGINFRVISDMMHGRNKAQHNIRKIKEFLNS